jgi:hypothetical protein
MASRLDLDAVDAALLKLGIDLDEDDTVEENRDESNNWTTHEDGEPAVWEGDGYRRRRAPDDENDAVDDDWDGYGGRIPGRAGADMLAEYAAPLTGPDAPRRDHTHEQRSYAPLARRPRDRRPAPQGDRPSDLPPLEVLAGYRRDRRGTWRYTDGGAVPGARDVTIDTLWSFGSKRPVVVPDDVARAAPELAWCLLVGHHTEIVVKTARRSVTVAAWTVDDVDWEDRARWPLTITAPELAPERLWGVSDISHWLAVTPSTVTSYLARGLLPEPQTRVGGRPAWSLPVLLSWRRRASG